MRKFKLEKLVRDKVLSQVKKNGGKPDFIILQKGEYIRELAKKLVEEAEELLKAEAGKIAEEIADVQEILDSLVKTLGVRKSEIMKLQKLKNRKAGSFKKRIFIKTVECDENYSWLKYYLDNPEKYPEIL